MKYYIGVDIGLTGAMSLINNNNLLLAVEPIPIIEILINKKKRNHYDIQSINEIIKRWVSDYNVVKAGLERLRPIPNQMAQTAFSMGGGSMMFKTLFTVHKISYIEIEPNKWQKEIFKRAGVQYNSKTTKTASIAAARTLFPGIMFKRTDKCKVDSSDLTDSAHIALYTKLIN